MNKKNIANSLIIMMIVVLSTFLYACTNQDNPEPVKGIDDTPGETPEEPPLEIMPGSAVTFSNVVDANNQFALDLYKKYGSEAGNVFFSPYSISSALSMTYEGAKGRTAAEMINVLHLPEDINKVRSDYETIYSQINRENKRYELKTANALWAQTDYPFMEEYLANVEKYYDGKATNLDFKKRPEQSRETINDWVEDETNNRIKDLIPKGLIKEDTRLVLTNTIYFKANWSQQFKKEGTSDGKFKLDSGETVTADMMHQTTYFNYGENEEMQILEMDYIENELSMLIILPKENNIQNFEESFNSEKLKAWKDSMQSERVMVALPKFSFETKYLMSENLKKMGMPTAFKPLDADFTGMYDATKTEENVYIGEVVHQTFIEVAEYGTEAAAATAVMMAGTTSVPEEPKIFTADHPFIFIIQQKESGNILFMGRLSNPED